jgi:2-keto-4-pentenoate hydratase/2-oxohepta-3-ene-1,7-dioic acid hydratase in catechol pathway
MHLVTYLGDDGPAIGVLTAHGRVLTLRTDGGLDLVLAEEELDPLLAEAGTAIRELGDNPGAGLDRSRLAPLPAIEYPGKVICVGLNYAEHVREGGRPVPARPVTFSKFANAVVGDGEPIIRPEGTRALDLEGELGLVIGRRAHRVPVERAMAHVAGYVVLNDVSARDWQGVPAALPEGQQGDGQWLRAKGSDTFLPVGADVVTPDELDPASGLRIRSWRTPGRGDGAGEPQLMQDGTTSDLIHGVAELVAMLSREITLEPGDLIATGTPAGVGVYRTPPVFLEPGDRVRCEIEGIGSVENPVIDWSDVPDDLEPEA